MDRNTYDNKSPACKQCISKRRLEPKKERPSIGYKRCNGCNEVKLYNEFWADKANKTDGCYSHCKICKTKSTYAWRDANKKQYNKSMQEYRAKMTPEQRRDIEVKKWFDLPSGWYHKTLTEQGNVCDICKKPNRSTKRCLAIDHHHKSGKVRGIVCYNCNRALHAFDNLDLFAAIQAYLKKHKEVE